jgi:hypothetical protein
MNSPASARRRARLIVDWEIQSQVLIRCVTYTAACTIYFSMMLVFTQWSHNPEQPLGGVIQRCAEDALYWLPGLLVLAPLAVHDLFRTTANLVGPVVRLQNEMKLLLQCQSDRPIRFRDGDHWPMLAGRYNQVRGELLLLRRQLAEYEAAARGIPLDEGWPLPEPAQTTEIQPQPSVAPSVAATSQAPAVQAVGAA